MGRLDCHRKYIAKFVSIDRLPRVIAVLGEINISRVFTYANSFAMTLMLSFKLRLRDRLIVAVT